MTCTVLLLLLLLLLENAQCIGMSNVHFSSSNVIKSKSPNVILNITGRYSIDKTDKQWPPQLLDSNVTLQDLKTTLWVCTKDTVKMMTLINAELWKKINRNIKRMREGDYSHYEPLFKFTANREMGCERANLTNGTAVAARIAVNKYGPIYFVDEVGITAFHFTQLIKTHHSAAANALMYCSGNSYSGYLYKLASRPACPDHITARKRRHVRGKIVVYKQNIVSYSHPVTKCTITSTYVYSNGGFSLFSSPSDNKPPVAKPYNADLNACKDTKEFVKYYPAGTITDNDEKHRLKCGPHHVVCNRWRTDHRVTVPHYFDYRELRGGHFENGAVAGTYHYGLRPYYQYMTARSQHDFFKSAIMIKSEMYIVNGVGRTPWGKIPLHTLGSGRHYYGFNDGVVVWDPIPPIDLCTYLPRYTAEVDSVQYARTDINDDDADDDDNDYLLYFVSDEFKSAIAVSNDQEIKDPRTVTSAHSSCLPQQLAAAGARLFRLNDEELLIWYPYYNTTNVTVRSPVKFHTTLNHQSISVSGHDGNTTIRIQEAVAEIAEINSKVPVIVNQLLHPPRHRRDTGFDNYTADTGGGNETGPLPSPPPPPPPPPDAVRVLDIENLQYQQYQDKLQDEANLHARVLQNCRQDQITYDNFKKLMDVDPTRALTDRLNRPVSASHGGNEYYNVIECEKVILRKVLKSLATNDTQYRLGYDSLNTANETLFDSIDLREKNMPVPASFITLADILVRRGNVQPSVGKCLSYPLVIFSLTEYSYNMIGQLTKSGMIRTNSFVYLEQCDTRRRHAFDIQGKTYYYENYRLRSTFPVGEVRDDIIVTVDYRRPSDTDEEERVLYHFPTSVVAENLYSVHETQSAFCTLTDLIYSVSATTLATIKYEYNPEYYGASGGGSLFNLKLDDGLITEATSGLGVIIGKLGTASKDIIGALGGAGSSIIAETGNSIKKVEEGGATLISAAGDALSETMVPAAIVIGGIIVVVVVFYILYKKVILCDDDDQQQHQHDDEDDDDDDDRASK